MENEKLIPLVCICIPVKNGSQTIADTIGSLLNQDYKNFEIIVCDNLSTDNTRQIVETFISTAEISITYMLNPSNGSAEENWNYLLKNISTAAEYIALYHADDLYEPTIISKQLALIESKKVGAVFTLSRLINENGQDISRKLKHPTGLPREIEDRVVFDYDELLQYTLRNYNFIKAPTFFFRKNILANYDTFFDLDFKTSADLDFWLRIAKKDKIAIVKEPLHLYRISTSQGTYILLKGKEELGDYFKVMDHHISLNKVTSETLIWHNAYKSLNLIPPALNLTKSNKLDKAEELLGQALHIKYLPKLVMIPNGLRTFMFGIALKCAIFMKMEKVLIKLIRR